MWDHIDDQPGHSAGCLSHDLPCQKCGHAMHIYLACDDLLCHCRSAAMPGAAQVA